MLEVRIDRIDVAVEFVLEVLLATDATRLKKQMMVRASLVVLLMHSVHVDRIWAECLAELLEVFFGLRAKLDVWICHMIMNPLLVAVREAGLLFGHEAMRMAAKGSNSKRAKTFFEGLEVALLA